MEKNHNKILNKTKATEETQRHITRKQLYHVQFYVFEKKKKKTTTTLQMPELL